MLLRKYVPYLVERGEQMDDLNLHAVGVVVSFFLGKFIWFALP